MLIPLANKILCQPILEHTKSSVVHTDAEIQDKKLRPEKGKVIAVGKEYKGELKKGNICYFSKYTVEWIDVNGKELVVGLPEDFFVIVK